MKSKESRGPDPTPQLPEESSRNFQAFCAYRDLGPSRSLEALRQLRSETASKTSLRWLQTLSARFQWCERARAFDKHMDMVRQRGREAAAVAQARLWESRINQALEDTYQDALMLRKVARGILSMPIVETTTKAGTTITKPGKWSFQTAAVLTYKAAEIQGLVFESVRRNRTLEDMSIEELKAIEDVRPEDFIPSPPSSDEVPDETIEDAEFIDR